MYWTCIKVCFVLYYLFLLTITNINDAFRSRRVCVCVRSRYMFWRGFALNFFRTLYWRPLYFLRMVWCNQQSFYRAVLFLSRPLLLHSTRTKTSQFKRQKLHIQNRAPQRSSSFKCNSWKTVAFKKIIL